MLNAIAHARASLVRLGDTYNDSNTSSKELLQESLQLLTVDIVRLRRHDSVLN